MVEEMAFEAQENIFEQGDQSDGMYLVLDGFALVIVTDDTGIERTIGIVSQGQSFGELGLLINQPRLATVAAGTSMRTLKITPEQLEKIEREAPEIASILYKKLACTLAEQLVVRGRLLGETQQAGQEG
jgi:CRP-like cAMP-binding protein